MRQMPTTAKEMAKLSLEAEAQIVRQGEVLEPLVKTPAWTVLTSIGQEQVNAQLSALMSHESPRDLDQYRKGVISGIKLILNTPALVLEHRREILESRRSEKPEDEVSEAGGEV